MQSVVHSEAAISHSSPVTVIYFDGYGVASEPPPEEEADVDFVLFAAMKHFIFCKKDTQIAVHRPTCSFGFR
jgi:hypothetical protein